MSSLVTYYKNSDTPQHKSKLYSLPKRSFKADQEAENNKTDTIRFCIADCNLSSSVGNPMLTRLKVEAVSLLVT